MKTIQKVRLAERKDGDLDWLNSNLNTLFTVKSYSVPGVNVPAIATADIDMNVALSGYSAIGIVGIRLNSYNKVVLVYADIISTTTAKVRVFNTLSTAAQTGDSVVFRILYKKN